MKEYSEEGEALWSTAALPKDFVRYAWNFSFVQDGAVYLAVSKQGKPHTIIGGMMFSNNEWKILK